MRRCAEIPCFLEKKTGNTMGEQRKDLGGESEGNNVNKPTKSSLDKFVKCHFTNKCAPRPFNVRTFSTFVCFDVSKR